MADTQPDLILVDLTPGPGFRGITFTAAERLEKSTEVVNKAMGTIRAMTWKIIGTVKSIRVYERPSRAEVRFGIKFDTELGAVLAKTETEAAISVTLTWDQKDDKTI